MELLLARVHMGAALSLEPILGLLGTLARDLRADFLPLLPRVLDRITELVETGKHFHTASMRTGTCYLCVCAISNLIRCFPLGGIQGLQCMQHAFACIHTVSPCLHSQKTSQ